MSVANRKALHFLKTNPKDWIGVSLPKFKKTTQEVITGIPLTQKELTEMPWTQRHDYLHSHVLERQRKRWEDEVGIKPEDSHFTLIVPVYNEEKSLPSFLRTLMFSDIPTSTDIKIIFVTNACSDASSAIIDAFLSDVGRIEDEMLKSEFKDRYLNRKYKATRQDGITFMHVDTQTPGKANALNIGNSIAREHEHVIAMSVDANNYLEPDAIRVMFTNARKSFQRKLQANDIVLLSGMEQTARKASHLKKVLDREKQTQHHLVEDGNGVVHGWFIAWNVEWMQSIGGPPPVALEDYAMGVLARASEYKIAQVTEANIWGYDLNDLEGLVATRARYVRGKLQIIDFVHHDPSVVRIIENEAYYMKSLSSRVKYLLHKSKELPHNLPRYVATFLLWEYALRRGKRDYKQNPKNQSWEKIDSTY